MLHELIEKSSFWSVIFSYSTQEQQTISWWDCDMWWKVVLCDNWQWAAQWLDQEEAPKHFPKPNLHQKKVMVTIWWSAASLIHYSFLNTSKTITSEKYAQQTDKMYPKLPAAHIGQQKEPNSSPQHPTASCTTSTSKVEQIGLQRFAHLPYSPDHSSIGYHFFKHLDNFLTGKTLPQPEDAENTFQEFTESQSTDFYATGINKLISPGKNVLIVMVPLLINKGVFEPSYNDLKFTIWNCNYVCTHLMYMYHIFYSRSSADGHLGCFCVLTIVNTAAITLGCMFLFKLEFSSFLDICPGMGLLDHVVALVLAFKGVSILRLLYHFTFPATVQAGSLSCIWSLLKLFTMILCYWKKWLSQHQAPPVLILKETSVLHNLVVYGEVGTSVVEQNN